MQPLLGREMAEMRSDELQRRAAQDRAVREARTARRQAIDRRVANRTPRFSGVVLPWRAVARGRAVGKVRTRTAADPC